MKLQACIPLVFAALMTATPPAFAGGPVLVTVTGAVEAPNRGALDPDFDKLFAFNELTFDKAHEFDMDALAALPQVTLRTDFPKGGPQVEFTGPLLADVLTAAGAAGETVTIQAMDGYAAEAPYSELAAKGAVLAIAREGRPLGIGSFGPAQLVFPRSDRPELAQMPDDWWIWQVFHVKVE